VKPFRDPLRDCIKQIASLSIQNEISASKVVLRFSQLRYAGPKDKSIKVISMPTSAMSKLTFQNALDMIAKAKQKAEQKVRVSIFVLDSSGIPVALARMDGADFHTADVARAKAYTAAAYSKNTWDLVNEMKSNPLHANGLMQVGRGNVVFIGGGVLAMKDGEIVGAVGVSGADADQYHACGIEAVSQV
jgi:uncharacterized protein GlcG (DUF336 family)